MSYASGPGDDWFAQGASPGLRFSCTMCGNCCTGPEGYVLYTDEDARRIAGRLGVSAEEFIRGYTKETMLGRSLAERPTAFGLDCIFLDRQKVPGKAVCGIYEDRPAQCRTWPFWKSITATVHSWDLARRTCPGIGSGPLIPPERIRILRDTVDR